MLEFFRKHQRYFFIVITVMVITSFSFFGTYSTYGNVETRDVKVACLCIDGSPMKQSEILGLARFISTDREDFAQPHGSLPNFCNDGVIRNDFLKTRLADLLVSAYFDSLKNELALRLEKAKRFRPYAHPESSAISAKAVWSQIVPNINVELEALREEKEATPALFGRLASLYKLQSQLPPELLRRILMYQHQQYSGISVDQRLSYEDLSLFGFHSISDWFGKDFVHLVSEFILNGAAAAVQKGYSVSLEEAKGDLLHNFEETVQKLVKSNPNLDTSFSNHLRSLGFDEATAVASWQKVLLFRRYFQDVGEVAFVDRLPYQDFTDYAKETAVVDKYSLGLKNSKELQFYLKTVCPMGRDQILSLDAIEKSCPDLVRTDYKGKVAQVTKQQVALRAPLKEVWDWEVDEKNWAGLRKKFPFLSDAKSREDRFSALQGLGPKLRIQVDTFARSSLVDENPKWIEEALAAAPLVERSWSIKGNDDPLSFLQKEETWIRVESLEKVSEKHILTFIEAKPILSELVKSKPDEKVKEDFFLSLGKEALSALQINPNDPRYVKSGDDPIRDQFKFERNEQSIQRTSKENWMKDQAFFMMPEQWSPIKVAEEGEVVFFYLKERKRVHAPILDQLSVGKETLVSDAKRYLAEKLLQTVKGRKSIVIPLQSEEQ